MSDDRNHPGNPEFTQEDEEVGQDPWRLPATLAIPRGAGPFPALILVHGSGPNDRDETIGPNKPFRDLAWGLAARGVAVLRYEKRTRRYPKKMGALPALTVFEETIEDVGAAFKALAANRRVDPGAIYALGHSLGGYLMPRIAAFVPDLSGIIFWAASYRSLDAMILEQIDWRLR